MALSVKEINGKPLQSGGGGAWGTITGAISTQTDLQAALDDKASSSTLANYLLLSNVINVLTDVSTSKALSAAQGKVLKDTADSLATTVSGKADIAALSNYLLISNVINVLTDTSTNKALSAMQGKTLKDTADSLAAIVATKQNTLGFTPEDVSNKSTSVATDQASNTKYASVKAVFDWATSVFTTASAVSAQISAALAGYATQSFVTGQGYITNVITALGYTPLNKAGDTITGDLGNTSTGFFRIPSGTTAQRPSGALEGMRRYNTTTLRDEFFANGAWQNHARLAGDTFTGTIAATNLSGTNTGDNATNTQYSGLAASKQDTLISTTNIKTINGASILGAGDLTVTGFTAANISEVNTGSNNAKGVTPLGLEGSKYMTQMGTKTYAIASLIGLDYTLTLTPAITSYADGQELKVKFTNAPTGLSTFNVNTVNSKKLFIDATTQATTGSFLAGQQATVRYDTSLDGGVGGWLMVKDAWWSGIKSIVQTITGVWSFLNGITISGGRILFINTGTISGDSWYKQGTSIIRGSIAGTDRFEMNATGVKTKGTHTFESTMFTNITPTEVKMAVINTDSSIGATYSTSTIFQAIKAFLTTQVSNTSEVSLINPSIGGSLITIAQQSVLTSRYIYIPFKLSTTGTIQIRIRYGDIATALASKTLIADTGAFSPAVTAQGGVIKGMFIISQVGASGTAVVIGNLEIHINGKTPVITIPIRITTGVSTLVDNLLEVTCQFGTNSASDRIDVDNFVISKTS